MSKFSEFSKGNVKKNKKFYGWALVAAMFAVMGILAVIERKFQYRSETPPIEGGLAVFVGLIFISFGVFALYHLFFRAEAEELKHRDFHSLDDFEDKIEGYNTKFEVVHSATVSHRTSYISIFYYKLYIEFSKDLYINLKIKQRDKVECLLWKLGITRHWDILTGNAYFDSRYHVQCTNQKLFHKVFSRNVIQLLEQFNRDYPPIRAKNGTLIITDTYIKYVEGPYNEDQRIFDPHRGKIEDLFKELMAIISNIELNLPKSISESEKFEIIKLKKEIQEHNNNSKRKKEMLLLGYRGILYVLAMIVILISLFYNL